MHSIIWASSLCYKPVDGVPSVDVRVPDTHKGRFERFISMLVHPPNDTRGFNDK